MSRHVQDDDRRELEEALERQIGARPTATLMALLPADYARQTDLGVFKSDVAVLKTDVAVLKTDVAELKTDVVVLKADVAELRGEFTEFGHEVRTELVTLRADNKTFLSDVTVELSRTRLDLLAQQSELWFRLLVTIVAAMIGVGSMALFAVKL